jgi:alkylhydroperoxidase/carboxymuconolactone decarboxylase family protein YurZ
MSTTENPASPEQRRAKGAEALKEIYGPEAAAYIVSEAGTPYVDETIDRLFGEVWNRPGLSLRDRRLLVLGATAMLGRADLVEFQVRGGLLNGDFDKEQMDEATLQLAYYVGWGNSSAFTKGVSAALSSVAKKD